MRGLRSEDVEGRSPDDLECGDLSPLSPAAEPLWPATESLSVVGPTGRKKKSGSATGESCDKSQHSKCPLRLQLPVLRNQIPLTATSHNQVPPQLPADVRNIDIDQVRKRVVGLIEEVLIEHGPRHQLALMQRQPVVVSKHLLLGADGRWYVVAAEILPIEL